jgi:hypothetical protein
MTDDPPGRIPPSPPGQRAELCPGCPEAGTRCHGWHRNGPEQWCDAAEQADCADCLTPCCRFEAVRDRWLADECGLSWETWEPAALELPGVIFRLHRKGWGVPCGAVTISAEQILRPGGWTKARKLRERFEVADGDLLGLDWFVKDPILDNLATREPEELADVVEACGLDFMFGPNFSTFGNHGSISTAIGRARHARYSAAVAKRGIPVIPGLSWLQPIQAYRAIRHYGGHRYAAANLQLVRHAAGSKLLARHLADLRWLAQNGGWQIVAAGVHGTRARAAVEALGAVIWDCKLYRASEFRKNLAGEQVYGSREEAWKENAAAYAVAVERWRR